MCSGTMTAKASASVRLMSAVGAGSFSGWPLGIRPIQLHSRMKQNSVTASGTTNGATLMPMLSSTCLFTASTIVSKIS